MSVGKSGSGWAVKHCHGKKKGRVIAKHKTKKAAVKQHQAIQAEKARRGLARLARGKHE